MSEELRIKRVGMVLSFRNIVSGYLSLGWKNEQAGMFQ